MSNAATSRHPALGIVLLELPALPVLLVVAVGGTVSLAVGAGDVLAWTALTVAGLDAFVLGAFVVGGKRVRPLAESSLLAQILAPVGRFITGAVGMVAGGFFGAIIAVGVAADMTGPSSPGWVSEILGVAIGSAAVLGFAGSAIVLGRRVLTLKPGARAKSLRRGIQRLRRIVDAPVITLDKGSLLVRHLATPWYLLWLPLLTLMGAAIWLAVTVQ